MADSPDFASTLVTDSAGGISVHYPLGAALAGRTFKVWARIERALVDALPRAPDGGPRFPSLRCHWLDGGSAVVGAPCTAKLHASELAGGDAETELTVTAPGSAGRYTLSISVVDEQGAAGQGRLSLPVDVLGCPDAREAVMTGVRALSYAWGTDRGLPPHRYYLERFLDGARGDVRGRCLEFQEPTYAPRLGGSAVTELDILHVDDTNPRATIVADLTRPNAIPSDLFDCIICTHVLHVIVEVGKVVDELHRILKPGGVLLVGAPHLSACDSRQGECWRFTPKGLRALLERRFDPRLVDVHGYGNSLVAAADLRGLVVSELDPGELDVHDPWFPVEVCARAVKRSQP